MRFFSDNDAAVCPQVLRSLEHANQPDGAYDSDALSQSLDGRFSELFGADVAVVWMTTGTSANALALSLLCPPFGGVIAHEEAHVIADECGAVEFYTGGARLMGCAGIGGKLTPDIVDQRVRRVRPDVHQVQPNAVTITNASEYGLTYSPDDVMAIGAFCRTKGLKLHMDGARFANAVAGRACSPAALTWQGGVDALSFGFTKNGALAAEALVLFDEALAEEARVRRKRAGHLLSKGRFIAAQILAMLDDDLWLANARKANASAKLLGEAAGNRLMHPVEANEIFLKLTTDEAAHLRGQGFGFHDWGDGGARLVTCWAHGPEDVEPLANALRAL